MHPVMPQDWIGENNLPDASGVKISVFSGRQQSPIVLAWLVIALLIGVWTLWIAKPATQRFLYSDVSTHVMIASSVWHDLDLEYSLQDLHRFREDFPAESGPRGLFLKKTASGRLLFAKPYLYGTAAAVFYGPLGVNGFIVLNSISLFVIGLVTTLSLRFSFGARWGLVLAFGFVLPGPFLAWVAVPHPDLFIAALLAGGGYLLLSSTSSTPWIKVLGAVVFAAAIHEKPTFVVLLPFIMLAMPERHNLLKCAAVLGVTTLSWLALSTPNLVADGSLFSYQGVRFYSGRPPFPLEDGWMAPVSSGLTGHVFDPALIASSLLNNVTLVPEKLVDFVVGRQAGILPYFPVALLLLIVGALYRFRAGLWLFVGFFAYLGLNWLAFPTNGYGGAGSYGPRYMMQALPLIPLVFLRFPPGLRVIETRCLKFAVVVASLAALAFHHRVLVLGEGAVKMYADRLQEFPLSAFPAENWLLPTVSAGFPKELRRESPSDRRMILFDRSFLANKNGRLWNARTSVCKSVLFQYGNSRPIGDLVIWPVDASSLEVKTGQRVVWQGEPLGAQPIRISTESLNFDTEAFDLFEKRFVRFAELDIVPSNRKGSREPPILRFEQEFQTFRSYGRNLDVEQLAPSGASMLRGWGENEPWGVWTVGRVSQIVIYTGEDDHSYEVTLRLSAYVPDEDPVRKARLLANGRMLAEFEFRAGESARDERFRFRTEPGEKFIIITFEVENPISPAMLDRGSDGRLLGIRLSSMKLDRIMGD